MRIATEHTALVVKSRLREAGSYSKLCVALGLSLSAKAMLSDAIRRNSMSLERENRLRVALGEAPLDDATCPSCGGNHPVDCRGREGKARWQSSAKPVRLDALTATDLRNAIRFRKELRDP